MLAYRLLQKLLRFLIAVFYRQIDVVGREHVPAEGEGPVIFAGNHPNSLLDPGLIVAHGGRIVHFAAKDVLFQSRLLRVFLKGLGAVPLARRADHGDSPLDNQSAFERMFEVLVAGRAIGIFPEGLSHDAAQLARLKTGAARVYLGAVQKHPEANVRLIPVGLNYVRRRRFRSRVLMQFGPPLEVDAELLALANTDPQAAARVLTERLDRAMRALTVNAPDWDTLRVLDGVRRLYQPTDITLEQRAELARRFSEVYTQVQDRPEVKDLFARVRLFLDRLDDVGLSDRDLRRALTGGEIAVRVLQHVWLMLVWMPLAVPGSVVHLPLAMTVGLVGRHLSPRKDVIATTKLLAGFLGMGAAFALLIAGIAWQWGPMAALGAAVFLPLSGLAVLRVLERGAALKRALGTLTRLLHLRDEVEALRVERAALEATVLALVSRLIPADMVPLFPDRVQQATPAEATPAEAAAETPANAPEPTRPTP